MFSSLRKSGVDPERSKKKILEEAGKMGRKRVLGGPVTTRLCSNGMGAESKPELSGREKTLKDLKLSMRAAAETAGGPRVPRKSPNLPGWGGDGGRGLWVHEFRSGRISERGWESVKKEVLRIFQTKGGEDRESRNIL